MKTSSLGFVSALVWFGNRLRGLCRWQRGGNHRWKLEREQALPDCDGAGARNHAGRTQLWNWMS